MPPARSPSGRCRPWELQMTSPARATAGGDEVYVVGVELPADAELFWQASSSSSERTGDPAPRHQASAVPTLAAMRALGFVVELPWDLGVPDDYVASSWTPALDDRPIHDHELPPGIVRDPSLAEGLAGWIAFRTVATATQRPLAASDLAFGDLDAERSAPRRYLRRWAARRIMRRPFLQRRTVAVVYVPVAAGEQLSDEDIAFTFLGAQSLLNDWLVSVGVLFDDRLRPVTFGDLPPAVPVLPTEVANHTTNHAPSFPLALHGLINAVRTYTREELEDAEAMLRIVTRRAPLAGFYEVVLRAGSARRAHRDREAVIDYATAGELFITAVLRSVGERRNVDPAKLDNILKGNFRDRVTHLARSLGVPEEPYDQDSPILLWWLHCYQQRNRVVHEGAYAHGAMSELARMGLVMLVVDIREALRESLDLAPLAAEIYWAYRVDETGEGRSSFPDPIRPHTDDTFDRPENR